MSYGQTQSKSMLMNNNGLTSAAVIWSMITIYDRQRDISIGLECSHLRWHDTNILRDISRNQQREVNYLEESRNHPLFWVVCIFSREKKARNRKLPRGTSLRPRSPCASWILDRCSGLLPRTGVARLCIDRKTACMQILQQWNGKRG